MVGAERESGSALGGSDVGERLVGEGGPRVQGGVESDPLLRRAAPAAFEGDGDSRGHELGAAGGGELEDQLVADEHGEDLAVDPKTGGAAEAGALVDVG